MAKLPERKLEELIKKFSRYAKEARENGDAREANNWEEAISAANQIIQRRRETARKIQDSKRSGNKGRSR